MLCDNTNSLGTAYTVGVGIGMCRNVAGKGQQGFGCVVAAWRAALWPVPGGSARPQPPHGCAPVVMLSHMPCTSRSSSCHQNRLAPARGYVSQHGTATPVWARPVPTAGSGSKWRRPQPPGCQRRSLPRSCRPRRRTPRCRGPGSRHCSPSASSRRHRTPSPRRGRTSPSTGHQRGAICLSPMVPGAGVTPSLPSRQSPGVRAPSPGTPAWQQGSRTRVPSLLFPQHSGQARSLAPAWVCRHHPEWQRGSGSCSLLMAEGTSKGMSPLSPMPTAPRVCEPCFWALPVSTWSCGKQPAPSAACELALIRHSALGHVQHLAMA